MKICRADCQQGEESFSQDKWPIYAANSPDKEQPCTDKRIVKKARIA